MQKLSISDSIDDEIGDEIEDEIGEEIGLSVSMAAPKAKKRKDINESDSIPLAISGVESSRRVSKIQNSKFTNSIIADSNIVSEIEITNPIRHQEEESDI